MLSISEMRDKIRRIEAFEIDQDGRSLRFVDRLARENGWSRDYASRVELEYKRFCALAVLSGHSVTPSEDVDQAWHLHLTYSRSYWQRFCGQVLERPLHHEPTGGGTAEGRKFHDWYSHTLDSYRQIFQCDPPADIWPSAEKRFLYAGEGRWINPRQVWIIPKRPVRQASFALAGLLAVIGMAGCTAILPLEGLHVQFAMLQPILGSLPPFSFTGIQFLIFYSALAITALAIILWDSRRRSSSIGKPTVQADKLNWQEAAVLVGGAQRLMEAGLTELFDKGHVRIDTSNPRSLRLIAEGGGPAEFGLPRDLFKEISLEPAQPRLSQAVLPYYQRTIDSLSSLGLRHRSTLKSPLAPWIVGAVLCLGTARLIQGLATQHPVGFLIVLMVLFGVASLIVAPRWSRNTEAAAQVIRSLRESWCKTNAITASDVKPVPESQALGSTPKASATCDPLLMQVALMSAGATLLEGDQFADLRLYMSRHSLQAQNSSGCGTGCGNSWAGGSGCGSGGGDGGAGGGGCGGGGCGGCGGGCGS